MIRSIHEVYEKIRSLPPRRVAVAQAADAHVLQAVAAAGREGYAAPILVGEESRIRAIAAESDIDIAGIPIISVDTAEEAAARAVQLVHDGEADVLMKGLLDSSVFLRAVLNKETGLRKAGTVMSAIAVLELKKLRRLVFLTDLGITPAPDLDTKIKLVNNAVEVARKFGIETPNVAALSASESLNARMPSSVEAARLAELQVEGVIPHCCIAGPISFDLAMSEEAAAEKGYTHPAAGKADILLVPSIEVGNAAYKALMLFADMETGGIMAGTSAPVVFCSRADSAETKKNTLAMAIYLAGSHE